MFVSAVRIFVATVAVSFILCLPGLSKDVTLDWDITYVYTNRGLDQTPKLGIGVNGQLPIPPVRATNGDTLIINAHNSLDTPTSIHYHGLFQNGTNYYDGVYMTTECSIAPGHNFTYIIKLNQAGTYWIHGHTLEQNFDGLRTPLVIEDPDGPYKYDKEYMFAIEDWSPYTFNESMSIMQKPDFKSVPLHPPPLGLINGENANLTKPINFEPGKTYLIRLVAMQSLYQFEFTIDGHELEIVEVDGTYTKPKKVNVVRLSSGQRISVLVKAKPDARTNYPYRITILADYIPHIPGACPSEFKNVVEYSPNAPLWTASVVPSESFNDLDIESLDYELALIPDRSLYMNLTFGDSNDRIRYETINYIAYTQPKIPSLFTALSMDTMAKNPIVYGPQVNSHILKHLEVIEVLLWSPTSRPHPMHLHGHSFQVIERGFVNDTTGMSRTIVPPNKAPLKRDTIFVNHGEYYVIRFCADNPGVWLLHCHTDWHMGQGMGLALIEAPEIMQKRIKVPESVYEQCRIQGIKTEGNAIGNLAYNCDGAPNGPHLH